MSVANSFGKLTFLVVDDFDNFRLSMRQMLRSCGADRIELVGNGASAIQYCTYNHVDVVLCDYNLGEGKNGQHILEELRHRKILKRSSLFLMVTAETSKEMVMGARECKPDGYLTKPINRAMLENRLSALIAQRDDLLPINRQLDLENYPEAISLCLQALPRQPRYKTWLLKTLGELYLQLGDLTHAAKVYDDVLAQRELSWASLGRSKVLLANQRFDQAVASLRDLIDKHPDYVEAYDLLADGLEKQGRRQQAQQVLEQATSHSPNALLRQRQLAELASSNQDVETASKAWRRTVKLGTHSIHDAPRHHLALGQSLSDLSEGEPGKESRQLADEALSVLTSMERRFPDNPELKLHSRIVQCRIHAGQDRSEEAEKLLAALRGDLDDHDSIDSGLGLDYAKTLFRMKHNDEAKALLGNLAERFNDAPDVLKEIENLLDEPAGYRDNLEVRSLNRDGIQAFESGNLNAAAEAFTQALEVAPDHAALNLNLAQVLLKKYLSKDSGDSGQQLLDQCQRCLARLNELPSHHRQYRRYQALLRQLQGLSS